MLVRATYGPYVHFLTSQSPCVLSPPTFAKTTLVKVANDLHLAVSNSQFSGLVLGEFSAALGMEDHSFLKQFLQLVFGTPSSQRYLTNISFSFIGCSSFSTQPLLSWVNKNQSQDIFSWSGDLIQSHDIKRLDVFINLSQPKPSLWALDLCI